MADNVTTQSATLATPPAATVIATDDVVGVHYQRVKLVDGTLDSTAATGVIGGPLWVRLSDGAAAYVGQKTMANSLPVAIASDQASIPVASTLAAETTKVIGTVNQGTSPWVTNDPGLPDTLGQKTMANSAGVVLASDQASIPVAATLAAETTKAIGVVRVSDGTNTGAVKAASAIAAATDPAQVVQQSPQRADASTLAITVTAAVNTAATATLPAAAGLFHYITSIQVVKLYSVVGIAAGAGVIITSTNLPGNPAWTTEQLGSVAGTAATVVNLVPTTPIKSSVVNTATTIVAPVQLQTIWRINVTYYTAP